MLGSSVDSIFIDLFNLLKGFISPKWLTSSKKSQKTCTNNIETSATNSIPEAEAHGNSTNICDGPISECDDNSKGDERLKRHIFGPQKREFRRDLELGDGRPTRTGRLKLDKDFRVTNRLTDHLEDKFQDYILNSMQLEPRTLIQDNLFSQRTDSPISPEITEVLRSTSETELHGQNHYSYLVNTDEETFKNTIPRGRRPRRQKSANEGHFSYDEDAIVQPSRQRSYENILIVTEDQRYKGKDRSFSARPRIFSDPCPQPQPKINQKNTNERKKSVRCFSSSGKRDSSDPASSKIPVRSPSRNREGRKTFRRRSASRKKKSPPKKRFNEKAAFRSSANYLFEQRFRIFARSSKRYGGGLTMTSTAHELWFRQAGFLPNEHAVISANFIFRQCAGAKSVLTLDEYKELLHQMCAMTNGDYWEVLTRLNLCDLPEKTERI